ncbi:MAG: HAD family hydrolase [Polyangia bacterium]
MARRAAAFFDMDQTLLRVNSGSRWVAFLRERGEVGLLFLLRSSVWLFKYKLAVLDMETLARRLVADMAGSSESEMLDKAAIFWEREVRPAISPEGEAAIAEHRARGHAVVLLTSATPYVAEPLARHLGLDEVLCTRLHVEDGRFVGTCDGPTCYGSGKVHHARRFAEAHDIDLAESYFYTDSFSDLPMLERVGRPCAVNPDRRLRRHAERSGWPILRW